MNNHNNFLDSRLRGNDRRGVNVNYCHYKPKRRGGEDNNRH